MLIVYKKNDQKFVSSDFIQYTGFKYVASVHMRRQTTTYSVVRYMNRSYTIEFSDIALKNRSTGHLLSINYIIILQIFQVIATLFT